MKTDVIPDPDSIILDGKENIYISSLAEICLFKHVDDIVGRMKSCHCHSSINISDTKTIFYYVKKIIVQLLSSRPISPHSYLVYLHESDWPKFLWADDAGRRKILEPYIGDLRHNLYSIRELTWVILDCLNDSEKEDICQTMNNIKQNER